MTVANFSGFWGGNQPSRALAENGVNLPLYFQAEYDGKDFKLGFADGIVNNGDISAIILKFCLREEQREELTRFEKVYATKIYPPGTFRREKEQGQLNRLVLVAMFKGKSVDYHVGGYEEFQLDSGTFVVFPGAEDLDYDLQMRTKEAIQKIPRNRDAFSDNRLYPLEDVQDKLPDPIRSLVAVK